jgi:hypothetical protein
MHLFMYNKPQEFVFCNTRKLGRMSLSKNFMILDNLEFFDRDKIFRRKNFTKICVHIYSNIWHKFNKKLFFIIIKK